MLAPSDHKAIGFVRAVERATPAEPVSRIVGRNCARATASVEFSRGKVGLRLREVRTAAQQGRGKPIGHRGRAQIDQA
jgi:hypothetical protein